MFEKVSWREAKFSVCDKNAAGAVILLRKKFANNKKKRK